MSELPEDDPRVLETLQLLMQRLGIFVGLPLDGSTVSAIRSLVEQTRNEFKLKQGHDFPLLAPLILPTSQFIAWFRQDLDNDEIRIKVLNLLREFHMNKIPVSAYELATAMKLTWPQVEPAIEYYRDAGQITLLQ